MKEKACGSGGGGEDRRLAGEGLENAEGGSADGDDAAMIAPGLVDDGGGGGWKRETFGMHMMARGVVGFYRCEGADSNVKCESAGEDASTAELA